MQRPAAAPIEQPSCCAADGTTPLQQPCLMPVGECNAAAMNRLPLAAEQRRSKAYTITDSEKNYNHCVYDSNISTCYGVGSFLFLLVSQVFIMVASKCFCCGKALSLGGSRAWAIILFIACWVTFFIVEVCLLAV